MLLTDQLNLDRSCRILAEALDGPRGVWAYAAFDKINHEYFGNTLATPLILWDVTNWKVWLGLRASACTAACCTFTIPITRTAGARPAWEAANARRARLHWYCPVQGRRDVPGWYQTSTGAAGLLPGARDRGAGQRPAVPVARRAYHDR